MTVLSSIQKSLDTLGVDGLVFTKTDRFQGEYTHPHDNILELVTGFTGSFGYAIVLKDQAALYVDGRYTLQAAAEVAGKGITVQHFRDDPMENFLKNCPPMTIGIDSWCFSVNQYRQWSERLKPLNITLKAIDYDFIDDVWLERPAASVEPVVVHDLCYAGQATLEKLNKATMQEKTAVFIANPDNICWLLNVRGNDVEYTPTVHSYLIVMNDQSMHWFVEPIKVKNINLPGVTIHPIDKLLEAAPGIIGSNSVNIDPDHTSQIILEHLKASGIKTFEKSDPFMPMKALKNPVEMEGFRQAHIADGKAVLRVINDLKSRDKVSEILIDTLMLESRAQNPLFQQPSFPTIAGIGDHGAIIHYRADEKSNREAHKTQGTMILIDSGGQYLNGTTDITRTIWYGDKDPTAEHINNYTAVLKGHIALSQQEFPIGTTGGDLDVLARQYLWNEGLNYDHGTGHGVGSYLSVHESPPRIGKGGVQVPLKPGMVISNEPGVYLPGKYGIRIENLFMVVPSERSGFLKFETLTCVPYEERLIDRAQLTEAQRQWLDQYHAWVKKTLIF